MLTFDTLSLLKYCDSKLRYNYFDRIYDVSNWEHDILKCEHVDRTKTLLNLKSNIDYIILYAGQCGYLELFIWLIKDLENPEDTIIYTHVNILKYYSSHYGIYYKVYYLFDTVRNNDLETIKYIYFNHDNNIRHIFDIALNHKNLNIIKWCFNIDQSIVNVHITYHIIQSNNLDIIKWFDQFGLYDNTTHLSFLSECNLNWFIDNHLELFTSNDIIYLSKLQKPNIIKRLHALKKELFIPEVLKHVNI